MASRLAVLSQFRFPQADEHISSIYQGDSHDLYRNNPIIRLHHIRS